MFNGCIYSSNLSHCTLSICAVLYVNYTSIKVFKKKHLEETSCKNRLEWKKRLIGCAYYSTILHFPSSLPILLPNLNIQIGLLVETSLLTARLPRNGNLSRLVLKFLHNMCFFRKTEQVFWFFLAWNKKHTSNIFKLNNSLNTVTRWISMWYKMFSWSLTILLKILEPARWAQVVGAPSS